MTAGIWIGTPVAAVSAAIERDPRLRTAYMLGKVDQTVAELFGVGPDDESVPAHVQQFALLMLDCLAGGRDQAATERELAAIIRKHKREAN